MTHHITSVTDLFEALGRDAKELLGLPEADWLDFKKEPYHLDNELHCIALAKDASAMANTDQGVILLGVETRMETSRHLELATEIRPIADRIVNAERIQDVIHSWVHPALDVAVKRHAVPGSPGALWTVLIERQRERDRPFMVAREFAAERGPDKNLFGVYRRLGARNVPYPPSQVHEWLQVGFNASRHAEITELPAQTDEQATLVLQDDLKALALPDNYLFYYLQTRPQQPGSLSHFYQGSADSVFEAMQRIPTIRQSGFSLPEGKPDRTSWDGLRVVWPEEDSVSISRSGIVTAITGQRYLTWGTKTHAGQDEVWINPTALVEFTMEFCRFYVSQVLGRSLAGGATLWRTGMRNLGGQYIAKLPIRPLVRMSFRKEAQAATTDDFDTGWRSSQSSDAGILAFECLSEVYARFGYDESIVPYSNQNHISDEAIRSIK